MRGSRKEAVVVSASEFIVSDVLAPHLPRLWARYPSLRVDISSQGEVVSLADRKADLAVRMRRPEGASLLAKKLQTLKLGLFASTEYLAGRNPAMLDLASERLIVYDDSYGRLRSWIGSAFSTSTVP
jgi:DNA-binding transcriptional LysR family regulator